MTEIPVTAEPTSTTSSTCTMTTTSTAILIITKEETSQKDFNALVASLPKHADNVAITDPRIKL